MRKLILKMSMSLDGFVGGANGEVDWIFPEHGPGRDAVDAGERVARGVSRDGSQDISPHGGILAVTRPSRSRHR
jgi:hypothetical protein